MQYYSVNFKLMYLDKFSLTELENMIPFERDIYIAMLENYKQEKRNKNTL